MNLPNKISLTRMFLTPVMIVFFLLNIPNGIGVFCALGIFIIASISDIVDGKIARKYNLITNFGKFIDQIADKFIATSAIILVLFSNVVNIYYASVILIIIVCRDTLVAGIRQIAAGNGTIIPADMFGKIKSVVLDSSSIILMLYIGLSRCYGISETLLDVIKRIGVGALFAGTALVLISGINYTINALPSLKEKKEDVKKEDTKKEKN